MNYNVFLIRSFGDQFLFTFEQEIKLRPKVGDVLTQPITLEELKILRDEIPSADQSIIRFTDEGQQRITDDGDIRVTNVGVDPESVTHNYFVTPANNPNRIASYSSIRFADDQTLKQLFR